ncbi:MAG: two-component regulator propeller domain-containing protein [Clostridium sp.]|nr:two-component regulator propeller domain-containing protein [Clostridium sp.]
MNRLVKRCVLIVTCFTLLIGIFNYNLVFADKIDTFNKLVPKNEKINFENLTIEDGLSSNFITAIFQDSRGYIWIGTDDGLNQYNGNYIVEYNYGDGLASTYINAICEDSYGNIWVGTKGGLSIINSKTEEIKNIKYDNSKSSISHYNVTTIYKDSKNIMWVGTEKGLNKYDDESKTFIKYYDEYSGGVLTDSYITDIKEIKDEYIVIGSKCGVSIVDMQNDMILKSSFEPEQYDYIYNIEVDNNGDIWFATKNGIHKYDYESDTLNAFTIDIDEEIYSHINYILCDENNNLWFASSNGVIKYNEENELTVLYKADKQFINSLSSDNIHCFLEDSNGLLWIGTDNGISKLNVTQQINNKINLILKENGIEETSFNSIIEDSDGDLWIGTKYHGLINILVDEEKLIRYIYDEDDINTISSNTVKYITEFKTGEITVVTDKGIDLINKHENKIIHEYVEELNNDSYLGIEKIIIDNNEYYWMATNKGIVRLDPNKGEIKTYKREFEEYGLEDIKIVDIFQDKYDENILWLAGGEYTGLIKFHKTNGIIKNYINSSLENCISYDVINCIQSDDNGNLWIGTNSGLNKFNIETEEFTVYSEADGMISDYVNSIIIDDNEDIWIGTNNGLCKFEIKKNKFTNYNSYYGIQGSKFNLNSSWKTKSGYLLLGTTEGVFYFNPNELYEESNKNDKVIIGSIRINNKKIDFNEEKEIKLKYNENNVIILFFLPDYRRYSGITYEYKLEGLNEKWIYSHDISYANYTVLSPGKYTFKVRAMQDNGDLTEESSITIIIKSPWWKTKIAYCFYILIIGVIIFYFWNHMKILKALVKKQTQEINEKMKENQMLYEKSIKSEKFKNDYFVNLSHELRTPINVILSTVQLINSLNKDKDVSRKRLNYYMEIVQKSSNSLLKIINDIIDSSKIEAGSYKINKEDNVDIVYLVEETALTMRNYIKERGIELIIDPEIEEKYISCDPNEIERCIVNIIGNAIKFTPEGGRIEVFIEDNDNSVSISIKDTGIGISEEDQKFIFNRFEQGRNGNCTKVSSSGIGLTLVKYIVKLHNGSIELESKLEEGTKVTIKLPCR